MCLQEVKAAEPIDYIDADEFSRFLTRISFGQLTRQENPFDHFCFGVIPYTARKQKIFLNFNSQTNQWYLPEVHILPHQSFTEATIQYSFLKFSKSSSYNLEFFTMTKGPAGKTVSGELPCQTHYTIWYSLVLQQSYLPPAISDSETGAWHDIFDALSLIKMPKTQKIMSDFLYYNLNISLWNSLLAS